MVQSRWQKIERIFSAASDLTGLARDAYLRTECRGDDVLVSEVQALLDEHDRPLGRLDVPVFDVGLRVLENRDSEDRTGSDIGHYRIGRLIGRGGMGAVYAGEDTKGGHPVAIKLVNEVFALDPERIRRFRKEANAASRVSHPNVARLYELYEFAGEHLIAMELVEGEGLRDLMSGPMPKLKALDIAIQIASALGAAHAAGVVHRDIKPENIIVRSDGTVKVLDFGLAKLVDPIGNGAIHIPGGDDGKLTVDMSTEFGALMGTPAYMSPEQIRGTGVDTRSDIWSLGVLLYEMLSGVLPFRGPTKIDMIAAVLVGEMPLPRIYRGRATGRVNQILQRALAKEKTSRYRNAGELLSDLRAAKDQAESASAAQSHSGRIWAYGGVVVLLFVTIIAALPSTRHKIASYFYPPMRPSVSIIPLPVTDGLVSHWPADGNADDIVGGNNGELLNGATYRPGVSGQAFSFDGIDDIMVASTNGLPIGNADRTVALWVLVDSFTVSNLVDTPEEFFGGYGHFGEFTHAYMLGSGSQYAFVTNWGKGISGGVLKSSKWYHVAAVTRENMTSLYVDAVLKKSVTLEIDTPANTQFFCGRILGELGDVRRLEGGIDEIAVYDRAVSEDEIRILFSTYSGL